MTTGLEGYEEVRRKLCERGYLEGRIERFVLRDLLGPGSHARHLARTGLKAAILGAPLLGGVLAGAAVAVNRPLLGPTDAFVLWLWFGLLAGAVLFVLDLGAATLVAARARRRGARPSDTLRAAAMVGLPVLAYLAALWGSRRSGSGWAADAAFLAAALAASLIAAWLAGLVSLAGVIGRTGEVPDRQRRFALVLVALLLPVTAALFAVTGAFGRPARGSGPSPFEVRAGSCRLVFIGVDGLDGELVQALAERGAVPRLLAGMEAGAVFTKRRAAGIEPPEVWTTILTGMPAEAHGVRAVSAARLPGVATPLRDTAGPAPMSAALRFLLPRRTVPTTGAGRAVRTLWEIVALKQGAAGVGWWASWPARDGESGEGRAWVVSDRVLPKLLLDAEEDRDASPAGLFGRLRADFAADREALRREFAEGMGPARGGSAARLLWESFLMDGYASRVSRRLERDPAVSASFVYLSGLDILRRRLEERREAQGLGGVLETQEAIEAYVRWLDALLGEALAEGEEGCVVIVGDPGRSANKESEGFVVVKHASVEPGCLGGTITDLDVAPLALALLGFPASEEMPGRSPEACLNPPLAGQARLPSYGRRGVAAEGAVSAFDPDMTERLRSLGYLR